MPIIYSTCSNDQLFTEYTRKVSAEDKSNAGGGPAVPQRKVLIRGKANVINQKTFITPRGVATKVTDEELAFLQTLPAFRDMVKNRYLSIDAKAKKPVEDLETIADDRDMQKKDGSAQMTPKDFINKRDAAKPEGEASKSASGGKVE